MTSKWTNNVAPVVLALRSWTGIFLVVSLVAVSAFLTVSFLVGTNKWDIPDRQSMWFTELTCPDEFHRSVAYALSWGGALLPLGMSLLLVVICLVFATLRDRWILTGLPLAILVVVFAAYCFSKVVESTGIKIYHLQIGAVSGTLASLFIIRIVAKIAWEAIGSHTELKVANLGRAKIVLPYFLMAIAVGYAAGIVGTIVGADILRNCSLLESVDHVVMGAQGIGDAVSLAGLAGAILTIPLTIVAGLLTGLVTWMLALYKGRTMSIGRPGRN